MTTPVCPGGGIVPVNDWNKLAVRFGKGGLPAPFVQEILLIESYVAGTGFVENIRKKTRSVVPGSSLVLRREPANRYDDRAIQVLTGKGVRIGYVPRSVNPILSRLMDAGKILFAKVTDKNWNEEWLSLDIQIFLRDI